MGIALDTFQKRLYCLWRVLLNTSDSSTGQQSETVYFHDTLQAPYRKGLRNVLDYLEKCETFSVVTHMEDVLSTQ